MLRIVWLTFWCLFWTALTCTVVLHSRKFVFFCVVSGLCTAFIGASVYVKKAESNVAVAVVSDIPVHYGPYSEAAVRTTLRSGERMRIVRTLDDWMLLSLPGGVQGWSIHEGIVPVYLDE